MAKAIFTDEDDSLLAALGIDVETRQVSSRTPREERIIAGFEDIERFFEQHQRLPQNYENHDIFERLYAVRLDQIRASEDCLTLLTDFDQYGLLRGLSTETHRLENDLDDDALLAELGVLEVGEHDITKLTHVKTRAEIRAQADEVAQRKSCMNFEQFKPLFVQVQQDLNAGVRVAASYKRDTRFSAGEFYIIGGQKAYIAEVGEWFQAAYGNKDARLRVIFDNGTESNLLYRSFQKSLNNDDLSRKISEPDAGPLFRAGAEPEENKEPSSKHAVHQLSPTLFSGEVSFEDVESGVIYVLRSLSEHPTIKQHQQLLHKIGVTGDRVEKRIANARLDPTFLMADVEIVATYELFNINRIKLESVLHRFFESSRLDIQITDRLGLPISPREWFLVPLSVIDEVVEKIKDESLSSYRYDANEARLVAYVQ